MKRIGLCIVYKNWNYGSILQSYATLLKLQELGIDYEIIRYERRKNINYLVTSFVRLFNRDMLYSKLRKLRHSIGKKMHKDFLLNDRIRSNIFKKFVNENFGKFSVVIHRFKELSEYAEQFDAVLVGSDQLWLPSGLATNFFNLMFVPDKVKKVAYSTSFGVKEIPFYQKRRTIKYLNRIEYISVREHSGQAIVKRLTGREVPVILDPTMIIREVQNEQLKKSI